MDIKMNKQYQPQEVEDRIYKGWLEGNHFAASADSGKEPFTIVLPPPNVTGQLHAGHALNHTLQDILIRYNRMNGKEALWQPGVDHAGIATQIRVEKELRENEGITRHDLGREAFLERVWDWKNRYGNRIVEQMYKIGDSCDWDRLAFTMSPEFSKAVRKVFVDYYNKGIIYRGHRIINWCPSCTTALSDSEVNHEPKSGSMWHIRYPITGEDGYLIVATTRPETMLGDTAVAVNPKDKRYAHLIGKTLTLPLMNREIPVVADEYVDVEFGTGAVKVTPAHDPNDFEIGERHNLPRIIIFNKDATINENGGKYQGLARYDARKQIVADLEAQGLLEKIVAHELTSGECYRCDTVIEPLCSLQWFVKMDMLSGPAIDVVKSGKVKFIPERFGKIYLHWMENIKDWCVSRQLWWGHRIPAFYCDTCDKSYVSMDDMTTCECGAPLRQDEDVLDTWFSSALWPLVTLGWGNDEKTFNYFGKTDVLVTAYEIISLWVARMIFSNLEFTGEPPFHTVIIHGLVKDAEGRKMSKSLDNGVDPLEVVEQYGADSMRFCLAQGISAGNDIRFSYPRIEAARNFANKIWNASRFVMMNIDEDTTDELPADLRIEDKWLLGRYNEVLANVTANLNTYEFSHAAENIYSFIWDDFCDWYIEMAKPRIASDSSAKSVLLYVLSRIMRMLHPFMPFISEEIYSYLNVSNKKALIITDWDTPNAAHTFADAKAAMQIIMDTIKAIRNIRAEMNVVPSVKTKVVVVTEQTALFEEASSFFARLAYANELEITADRAAIPQNSIPVVVSGAEAFIPRSDLVDEQKERERLLAEKDRLLKEIARVEGKLKNEGFIAKAPESVVAEERAKGDNYRAMLEKVEQLLGN